MTKMTVYFKYDLPCFEIRKMGKYPMPFRWFLLGYMEYDLSNVEILEDRVYFELRDNQGLIGIYQVTLDNWERIVKIKKGSMLVESE